MKFPAVEVEKRDRDEHTDSLIKSLLDEEKASKKQKRGDARDVPSTSQAPAPRKGKTLAEIEAEEGGPVKESMVGMAHTKRALDRKKRDVDVGDTEVITNTERYEKDSLEVEEEDGIKFEPFNLKQEREEGYFDEDGNYVLRKAGEGEEGEEGKDAWLDSEEAKVVSESVRRRIEEQRAKAEEEARRGPLTERQIAQRKAEMAGLMQPGENVTRALKRLGGAAGAAGAGATAMPHRAMGKRERARLLAQQQAAAAATAGSAAVADDGAAAAAAREQFTRLTELADELLTEGELEVYGNTTEELLRSARMWLPQLAAPAAAGPSAAPGAAAAGPAAGAAAHGQKAAAAAADIDDDMFADDKEEGPGPAVGAVAGSGAAATAVDADQDMFADDDDGGDAAANGARGAGAGATGNAGVAPSHPVTAPAADATAPAPAERSSNGAAAGPGSGASGSGDDVDYSSWPIKELKRLLQERGIDPSGFVEKGDMVARVREVVAAGGGSGGSAGARGGGGGGSADAAAFTAPPGYAFDPSSGYFYSAEAGMYYDTNTGGYCQVSTGKWFYVDPASGSFVEWKQG